jgi:hypothetical protein
MSNTIPESYRFVNNLSPSDRIEPGERCLGSASNTILQSNYEPEELEVSFLLYTIASLLP